MSVANNYLVSKQFHVESAKAFVEDIVSGNSSYYVFAGKCTSYFPSDVNIPAPVESLQNMIVDTYDHMIFGKRIRSIDVVQAVRRYDWTLGQVFQKYDHEKEGLYSEPFYCVVNSGSEYHVYKCLDNNNGGPSTVEPSGSGIIYSPVDGYVWARLYSIEESDFLKFSTNNYMPVMANVSISESASRGTIENIEIEVSGFGYSNHYQSEFRSGDLRIGTTAPSLTYALQEDASSFDDFYNGCIIKMTSGPASGEYRKIVDYQIVSNKKQITIDTPFVSPKIPLATDSYEITPFVEVIGDGSETINCDARALVNSNDIIESIEILNPGEGYRKATARITTSPVVPVENEVSLRPIISPIDGHGSDPARELGANHVSVVVRFNYTEGGWIPAENDYRTIGIIKDPLFQNITINVDPVETKGTFINTERVYQYREIELKGSADTAANSAIVTGANTVFYKSLEPGDKVLVRDNLHNFFSEVKSVFTNTSFECVTSAPAAISNGIISLVDTDALGTVTSSTFSSIEVSDVSTKDLSLDRAIVGERSHATTVVNSDLDSPVTMNDREINAMFETFVNMERLSGTKTSLSIDFIEDELVTLANADPFNLSDTDPTGIYHSTFAEDGSIYLSETRNSFSNGDIVVGTSSGATFEITNKYSSDLVKDSGTIIYLENISPITRVFNRSETIRLVLEF